MQQPTLQNVRIRTAQDALQVFFGVARNALTLLTRRLDADERKSIRSGNVYVWEDRSATTSDSGGLTMERWCVLRSSSRYARSRRRRTDGMSWGPSRIRDVSCRPLLRVFSLDLCLFAGIFVLLSKGRATKRPFVQQRRVRFLARVLCSSCLIPLPEKHLRHYMKATSSSNRHTAYT
ncbi:hypothetical protein FA95DRAFT_1566379 [Auriscalpium vulgare]|uniref:Uncharacterized protein n=1 Tax=Auriscalpium vulgare TaxID=40419 RepID=A0ACB8R8L3_9AGAM|nr:hypothetical protein FA95DRAFT_1566379 [Auriscalpium vulgare]